MATFSTHSEISSTAISQLAQVEPGDLITASFMNALIGAVNKLQVRVADLEGQRQPRSVTITKIAGTTDPIRVGTRITVEGTNFLEPVALNKVTIGGKEVAQGLLLTGTDTQLTLEVPEIPLPTTGAVVPVVVSNTNGDSPPVNMTLHPRRVLPSGTIQVAYVEAPADAKILANKTYQFLYEIRAAATLQAHYSVEPTITGASDWTVEASERELTIPGDLTGVTKQVGIRVKVGSTTSGTVVVRVTAPGTLVPFGEASPILIRVDEPPPQPDKRVRISLRSPTPRPEDNRLVVKRNTPLSVSFIVVVNEAGADYRITPVMRDPMGWKRDSLDLETFSVTNVPDTKVVKVTFIPDATARDTDLVFNVTRGTAVNAQSSVGVSIT
jgi:hypothetical protein